MCLTRVGVTGKWHSYQTLPTIKTAPLLVLVSGKVGGWVGDWRWEGWVSLPSSFPPPSPPCQDEMVPPIQMRELHRLQRARSCKLVEFPDAHHMDAYDADPERYFMALAEFVNSHA